jgi:hypothetical protein
MKNWVLLFVSIGLMQCFEVESNENILSGSYIGYFHRNRSDTAQVKIRFTENMFEGKSHNENYPAVGTGLFEQKDNTITFYDSGRWKADTDKTLILNGTYQLQENDDGSIRIWREVPGGIDEYIFAPQAPEDLSGIQGFVRSP